MATTDGLLNKYDADVDFSKGESVTDTKLDNWDLLKERAFNYICENIGDVKHDQAVLNPYFMTNLARALGEMDLVEPARTASGVLSGGPTNTGITYTVKISADTCREVELPLPVAYTAGDSYSDMSAAMVSCSNSNAIDTTLTNKGLVLPEDLSVAGEWAFAIDSEGNWTNKIITYGNLELADEIVYKVGATGDLSSAASYLTVLPSRAQLQDGGTQEPGYTGVTVTDSTAYYTLTLPKRGVFNSGTLDEGLSGESLHIPPWYATLGVAVGEAFPAGLFMLWDEVLEKFISVNDGDTWPSFMYAGNLTSVRMSKEVELTTGISYRYALVVAGQSVAKAIYNLKEEVKAQDHKRIGRLVPHCALTNVIPPATSPVKYGPSKAAYGHHPHYLHRDGYAADGKNTNNAMHGHIRFSMSSAASGGSFEHIGSDTDETFGINFGDGSAGFVGRNVDGDLRIGAKEDIDGKNIYGLGRFVGGNFLPSAIVSTRPHADNSYGPEFKVYRTLAGAIAASETSIWLESGTHTVASALTIPDNTSITGCGSASIIEGTTSTSNNMLIVEGDMCSFSNLTFAAKDNLADNKAFIKVTGNYNTFTNCWFVGDGNTSESTTCFIRFHGRDTTVSVGNRVENCSFTAVHNISTATGLPYICIYDEGSGNTVSNNYFQNYTIAYRRDNNSLGSNNTQSFFLSNILYQKIGETEKSIYSTYGKVAISENHIWAAEASFYHIYCYSASVLDDIRIQNNTLSTLTGTYVYVSNPVYLKSTGDNVSNAIVSGNTILGSGKSSIFIENGQNIKVIDNILSSFSSLSTATPHSSTVAGIAILAAQGGVEINNNRLFTDTGAENPRGAGIFVTGAADPLTVQAKVNSNSIDATTVYDTTNTPDGLYYAGIYIGSSNSANNCQLQANNNNIGWICDTSDKDTTAAIYFIGKSAGTNDTLIASGNSIHVNKHVEGLRGYEGDFATISNNNIVLVAIQASPTIIYGIRAHGLESGTITGNSILGWNGGILGTNCDVNSNRVELGGTSDVEYGISCVNANGNTVVAESASAGTSLNCSVAAMSNQITATCPIAIAGGNKIVGNTTTGGEIQGTDSMITISNNYIRSGTNGTCVRLTSYAASGGAVITGNNFYDTGSSSGALLIIDEGALSIEHIVSNNRFYSNTNCPIIISLSGQELRRSIISNNVFNTAMDGGTGTGILDIVLADKYSFCSLCGNTVYTERNDGGIVCLFNAALADSDYNTLLDNSISIVDTGSGITGDRLTVGWGSEATIFTNLNKPHLYIDSNYYYSSFNTTTSVTDTP